MKIDARSFLRNNGFPDIGSRGRYSREMLDVLKAGGFDVDVPTSKKTSATNVNPIRVWALENGIAVNERGKLSDALKRAFEANDPSLAFETASEKREPKITADKQTAKTVTLPEKVRKETVAYVVESNGTVIAIANCSRCLYSIARCSCKDGIRAPKYLQTEGHYVSLVKPELDKPAALL